jgi:hypothetical protein
MLGIFLTVSGIWSRVGICESGSGDQGQSLAKDANVGESKRYDKVAGLSHNTYLYIMCFFLRLPNLQYVSASADQDVDMYWVK